MMHWQLSLLCLELLTFPPLTRAASGGPFFEKTYDSCVLIIRLRAEGQLVRADQGEQEVKSVVGSAVARE